MADGDSAPIRARPIEAPLRFKVVAKEQAPQKQRYRPEGRRYKEVLKRLTAKGHTAIVDIDTPPGQTTQERYKTLRENFRYHARRANKRLSMWRDGDTMCIELISDVYS